MKKISVIIPVYNVKNYLIDTVKSVINQSYKNIEIILVDDGSSDGSSELCDELEKNNDRISVIHQENMGLSGARNSGLRICTGDFISFIDGDDLINKTYYESLLHLVDGSNRTIGLCKIERFQDGYFEEKEFDKEIKTLDSLESYDEIANSLLGKKSHFCNVSACQFLFPKSVLNGIEFPVGKINEDWFFTYKVIDKADSIIFCNASIYYYRTRESSLSTSKIVRTDMLEGMSLMIEFFEKNNYINLRNKFSNIYIKRSAWAFFNLCRSGYDKEKKNYISKGIKKYILFAPCKYVSVFYYLISLGVVISPSFMRFLTYLLRRLAKK